MFRFIFFASVGPAIALLFRRVIAAQQAALVELLALATQQQLDVVRLLDAYSRDLRFRPRARCRQLVGLLERGTPLVSALASIPGIVSPEVLLQLRVAEITGTVPATLDGISERQRADNASASSDFSMSAWLCLTGLLVLLILGFIVTYTMPRYIKIMDAFGLERPWLTNLMIEVGDLTITNASLSLPILAVVTGGLYLWMYGSTKDDFWFMRMIDRWKSKLFPRPWAPPLLHCLAAGVAAQAPLPLILETIFESPEAVGIASRLRFIERRISVGEAHWTGFVQARLLREREAQLLDAAERAGNLSWALEEIALRIEQTSVNFQARLREWIQIAALLMLGLVVALFALGNFLPLVKIIEALAWE